MPTGRFSGRVLPSFLGFTFTDISPITLNSSSGEWPTARFSIQVTNCVIVVDCQLSRYQDDDLGYLHVRALDLTRACIDVAAFATGQGMTPVLDTFTKPDGETVLLAFAQRDLAKECTVYKVTASPTQQDREDFRKVMSVVIREPALFMALGDLTHTLAVPHQVPTNCGRVLDGLRRIVAPGVDVKKGWSMMHDLLNVDVAYMKWISDQAIDPRHGDRSYIAGSVIKEISRRTWAIMNRFLEYRKRGNQPLSVVEFPVLTSSNVP